MIGTHVARLHGINANQSFKWRRQHEDGSLAVASGEEVVVPVSELAAANKQISELQRLPGKKTMAAGILKEAVEFSRAKNGLRMRPCCPGTMNNRRLPGYRCVVCATEHQGSPVS